MYRTLSSVKYYKSYINLHWATRSLFCVFLLCFFVVGAVFLFFGDLVFVKNADLSVSLVWFVLGLTARFLHSVCLVEVKKVHLLLLLSVRYYYCYNTNEYHHTNWSVQRAQEAENRAWSIL